MERSKKGNVGRGGRGAASASLNKQEGLWYKLKNEKNRGQGREKHALVLRVKESGVEEKCSEWGG